jgi:hypothetical protein
LNTGDNNTERSSQWLTPDPSPRLWWLVFCGVVSVVMVFHVMYNWFFFLNGITVPLLSFQKIVDNIYYTHPLPKSHSFCAPTSPPPHQISVRHGYPWVPTDQAHDHPQQVGPAYQKTRRPVSGPNRPSWRPTRPPEDLPEDSPDDLVHHDLKTWRTRQVLPLSLGTTQ